MTKECPFHLKTLVVPFSSGTDAMIWKNDNCDKCTHYESESTDRDKAKCKLAFDIDLGFVGGDITLNTCKEIGCEYNPLYQSVELWKICRKRRLNDNELPY